MPPARSSAPSSGGNLANPKPLTVATVRPQVASSHRKLKDVPRKRNVQTTSEFPASSSNRSTSSNNGNSNGSNDMTIEKVTMSGITQLHTSGSDTITMSTITADGSSRVAAGAAVNVNTCHEKDILPATNTCYLNESSSKVTSSDVIVALDQFTQQHSLSSAHDQVSPASGQTTNHHLQQQQQQQPQTRVSSGHIPLSSLPVQISSSAIAAVKKPTMAKRRFPHGWSWYGRSTQKAVLVNVSFIPVSLTFSNSNFNL